MTKLLPERGAKRTKLLQKWTVEIVNVNSQKTSYVSKLRYLLCMLRAAGH